MKVEYLPAFIKDIKSLKSSPIYAKVKIFAFEEILLCENLSEVGNIKKLKGEVDAYRVRIGDYRVRFSLTVDTITFTRVPHRKEFYRNFP